jgi:hypothetical protein
MAQSRSCSLGSAGLAAAVVLLASAVYVACDGKTRRGPGPGEHVQLTGTLSLRGSQPFPLLVVETDGGETVVVESQTIEDELRELSGMRVSIEGEALARARGETLVVNALSYRLLALPGGEVPVVGLVLRQEDRCVLESADGKRYWIVGDLAAVIRDFEGAKVWVVGTPSADEEAGELIPLRAAGYGVLSQP